MKAAETALNGVREEAKVGQRTTEKVRALRKNNIAVLEQQLKSYRGERHLNFAGW